MYRLPGDRIALDLDGPTVEVEPIHAWAIQFEGQAFLHRWGASASGSDAEYLAFTQLCEYVSAEAQPQWDVVDHKGPVPTTARGLMRLPLKMVMAITMQWLGSLIVAEEEPLEELPGELQVLESDAPSAVDALVPPGPLNRELKARLRAAKRAKRQQKAAA